MLQETKFLVEICIFNWWQAFSIDLTTAATAKPQVCSTVIDFFSEKDFKLLWSSLLATYTYMDFFSFWYIWPQLSFSCNTLLTSGQNNNK